MHPFPAALSVPQFVACCFPTHIYKGKYGMYSLRFNCFLSDLLTIESV